MATKYNMREMNDLNGKGSKSYPQMLSAGVITSDEIAEIISRRCTLNPADITAALSALSEIISEQTAMGYSVKLSNLGIFSASLAIKKDKDREKKNGPHRNAQSIKIGNIKFKADKKLVQTANQHCHLERSQKEFRQSSDQYSLEERIELAHQYIKQHKQMKIAQYAQITGLTQSTASRELRKLAKTKCCGLQAAERGPLLHYIWVE